MKGYRTLIYNWISGFAASGVLMFLATQDLTVFGLDKTTAMQTVIALTLVDRAIQTYLRAITDTPMGEK